MSVLEEVPVDQWAYRNSVRSCVVESPPIRGVELPGLGDESLRATVEREVARLEREARRGALARMQPELGEALELAGRAA